MKSAKMEEAAILIRYLEMREYLRSIFRLLIITHIAIILNFSKLMAGFRLLKNQSKCKQDIQILKPIIPFL